MDSFVKHWPHPGDPVPDISDLLSKERLAQIRVRQIEHIIAQLTNQIEVLNQANQLLKEEYKMK